MLLPIFWLLDQPFTPTIGPRYL